MGDLRLDPICDDCGCRHDPIGDCTPLMTRAVDDPKDPAFRPNYEQAPVIGRSTLVDECITKVEDWLEDGVRKGKHRAPTFGERTAIRKIIRATNKLRKDLDAIRKNATTSLDNLDKE